MDDVMTLQEMEKRFDGEWVLVSDPEVDEHFRVIRGKVVSHSKDRDEVYRKAVELKLKSSASLCFAAPPECAALSPYFEPIEQA